MNVYRKALYILDTRGWTKGDLISPLNGQVCLIGAVGLATGLTEPAYGADGKPLDEEWSEPYYKNPALNALGELADEMFPQAGENFTADPSNLWWLNDGAVVAARENPRLAVEQLLEKAAIREEERVV